MADTPGTEERWYTSIEMTPEERAAFMRTHRMGVFSTIRKSGAPFGITLGFLHIGDVFDETTPVYLALGGRMTLVTRLKNDPRICMTLDNGKIPTAGIIAEGTGAVCPDTDGEIAARFFGKSSALAKSKSVSEEIDAEEFRRNSAAVERTFIRIDFHNIISWESRKKENWAKGPSVHAASAEHRAKKAAES